MHDVVTGFFTPNSADNNDGIRQTSFGDGHNCFGITTNIINGGLECGQSVESYGSQHRADYYLEFLSYFGLPEWAEEECLGCGGMKN